MPLLVPFSDHIWGGNLGELFGAGGNMARHVHALNTAGHYRQKDKDKAGTEDTEKGLCGKEIGGKGYWGEGWKGGKGYGGDGWSGGKGYGGSGWK